LIKDSKPPNFISLAVLDFIHESQESHWNKERSKQLDMFDPNNFERVKKLPFKFKYIFKDETNKILKLIITYLESRGGDILKI
jgi:hypothetical protein